MSARQLLETIAERGGAARLKFDATGAAKINVAPRTLALELLPELQRFKPALLELLAPSDSAARDRVRPEVQRLCSGADVLAIGRLLLQLDSGEEIE